MHKKRGTTLQCQAKRESFTLDFDWIREVDVSAHVRRFFLAVVVRCVVRRRGARSRTACAGARPLVMYARRYIEMKIWCTTQRTSERVIYTSSCALCAIQCAVYYVNDGLILPGIGFGVSVRTLKAPPRHYSTARAEPNRLL